MSESVNASCEIRLASVRYARLAESESFDVIIIDKQPLIGNVMQLQRTQFPATATQGKHHPQPRRVEGEAVFMPRADDGQTFKGTGKIKKIKVTCSDRPNHAGKMPK